MRNHVLLMLALCFLSGCDKIDELTKFNMDYRSSVVIESTVGVELPFDIVTPDVETNSESEFAINDTRKDLIEEIQLRTLRLEITTPEGEDFSFLESLEIFISAEGLEEIQIATISEIPEDTAVLDLDTSDADLKEYIKKDAFRLRLNTVTDEVLTSDVTMDVFCVFFVDARILGI